MFQEYYFQTRQYFKYKMFENKVLVRHSEFIRKKFNYLSNSITRYLQNRILLKKSLYEYCKYLYNRHNDDYRVYMLIDEYLDERVYFLINVFEKITYKLKIKGYSAHCQEFLN